MAAIEEGYRPPSEFQEDEKDSLVEIPLSDSTEFWLIQWPINQPPDFDGQEVSLKLRQDGQLGSFEGSTGKSYEVVSFASQEPDATVFLSSSSEAKVVGKISRRVSLVHYPEPSEFEKPASGHPSRIYQRSGGTSSMTPTRSILRRSSHSVSGISHGISTPSRSSGQKSTLSEIGEQSKLRRTDEMGSVRRSTHDSGREGRSDVTSSGSLQRSHQGKSKRKVKDEKE